MLWDNHAFVTALKILRKKHKIFACSSSLKDVKSLKAVHAAFDLLGNESKSFLRGSLANHSDRQGLDKVAVKVFSEDGPDQWGRGTKIQMLNFPAPSLLPENHSHGESLS